jgi:UDP-N-acetylmuramoyl-L-alanyl-D-glutamate--2,6-diaminopimelate ligase
MSGAMNALAGFEALLARVRGGAGVAGDSRRVTPGGVFVAVPGTARDGADFIPMALEKGAAHIVAARGVTLPDGAAASLTNVDDPREALGQLGAAHFGTERGQVKLAGVTGTNGKTTVTYLVEHLLASAGFKAGVIGTVEYRWPGHREIASHTTPDCLKLHGLVGKMGADGATHAVMEVSSHALDQGRVEGLRFDAAALTNVTQDHLDYHGSMEDYFQAKRRFFTRYLRDPKGAAFNYGDHYGLRLLEEFPEALAYGLDEPGAQTARRGEEAARLGEELARRGADRVLTGVMTSCTGSGVALAMSYAGQTWTLESPLIGAFNAANLLTAQAMGVALGLPVSALRGLAGCNGAPGRLERVPNTRGIHVFVDYAHTPDALVNVLRSLKALDFGKVVAVFGCGGDRDRTKRPLMAQAVAKWADVAVLTSDNPRFEDPLAIMDDARPGLAGAAKAHEEADRRKAIAMALELAGPGGCVLIAGKGHEDYQDIMGVKHPFSDVGVARELLA